MPTYKNDWWHCCYITIKAYNRSINFQFKQKISICFNVPKYYITVLVIHSLGIISDYVSIKIWYNPWKYINTCDAFSKIKLISTHSWRSKKYLITARTRIFSLVALNNQNRIHVCLCIPVKKLRRQNVHSLYSLLKLLKPSKLLKFVLNYFCIAWQIDV